MLEEYQLCVDNECTLIDFYTNKETAIDILTKLGYTYDKEKDIWVNKNGKCMVKVK